MHDKIKITAGIIIFLIIMLTPFWYNGLTGKATYVPQLKIGTDAEQCIENTSYMRSNHSDLLNKWKEAVVREGMRVHKAGDGKLYIKSLTGTCLNCHSNKAQFCDRCHNYAGAKPQCWDCHIIPGNTAGRRPEEQNVEGER
ncbi:MAG: sulfate reduction electron transfer complex DsrMKJOP subunit DsrJ [Deltaproteobacteria bacterium]